MIKVNNKEVDPSILGTKKDKDISILWGCDRRTVGKIRKKFGIESSFRRNKVPKFKNVDDKTKKLTDFIRSNPYDINVRYIWKNVVSFIGGMRVDQSLIKKIATENNIEITFISPRAEKDLHNVKKCDCKSCKYIKRVKCKVYNKTKFVLKVAFARKLVEKYFSEFETLQNSFDEIFKKIELEVEPHMLSKCALLSREEIFKQKPQQLPMF